jgi:hypothetical protein
LAAAEETISEHAAAWPALQGDRTASCLNACQDKYKLE